MPARASSVSVQFSSFKFFEYQRGYFHLKPNAEETFWHCKNITLKNVTAKGAYFALNSENILCENFRLTGGYCFERAVFKL